MPQAPLILAGSLAFVLPAFAQEKVTYVDHVRPLLENKCFSCHNPDKKKGDLDLTSFAATLTGGGSGSVINSGDPDGSKMIGSLTKKAEPYMPPEGAPLSAKEIEVVAHWIQGGVLETKSSLAKKGAPRANIALAAAPKGKPEGPPPMPENVLLEPVVVAPRGTAVTALAASPWAPLVAVAGMKQALIYDANTKALAGVYPYPEGFIRSLKFSQNGALLIAGGGRGGKTGNAVVWDVKTGHRVTDVGHEFDQVMCADISPNHGMIVIGSPSKKVKCYNASTGEELWVIKKHTEWILNTAFSPDGVLVASSDRNGGIIVSEAKTGGEFYVLDGHKTACTGLAWRSDSNVLASCAEDGKVAVWEMENGKLVKSWDAHGGGALSVAFGPDGNVVSTGRDGIIRVWDVSGKKLSESKPQGDLVTRVAALAGGKVIASGDWQGNVKLWSADKFEELGTLSSNPSPIAQRIADTERLANEILAAVPKAEAEVKSVAEAVKAKEAQVAETKKKAAEARAGVEKIEREIAAIPGQIDALKKTIADAQSAVSKQREQTAAQAKQLEAAVAQLEKDHEALVAEAAGLTLPEQAPKRAELELKAGQKKNEIEASRGQLDGLKQMAAAAPQSLARFEKQLQAAKDQVVALGNGKPAKEKELAAAKKALEVWPKQIADAEKGLADARAAQPAAQQKLDALRTRLAWAQKYPAYLKAAQFNVNVLAEKEQLEKLDAEVRGLREGLKEADAARVAATARIEAAKKTIADAVTALPAFDAALIKVKGELPAVEKILEPTKAEEGKLVPLADAQRKIISDNEAARKNLEQEKANRVAAAQKAAEEITKQIAVLQKQSGEVNAKAAGPLKTSDETSAALAKAETELAAAKGKQTDAAKLAQQRDAELKAAQAAQPPADPLAVATTQRALADATAAAKQADGAARSAEKAALAARTAVEAAEKTSAPLRAQQKNIAGQIEAQKASLAAKQAEPGEAEKELAAKSQPLEAAIAAAKEALAPIEKQLADIRARLALDTKTVEAKRAEVAKAQKDVDDAKRAQVVGQKSIDDSTKEIADRTKAIEEGEAELAKLEPQLGPRRDAVKRLSDQYLTMLPK
jgi:WD40 repeat protein